MKKVFSLALLIISAISLQAQKIDRAKDYLEKKKLNEAKTEIENFLAIEKNKANTEALYVKAKVYVAISKDAALKSTVTDPRGVAFETMKQYLDLEKGKDSTKKNIAMMMDNNGAIFDLYRDYSADGATFFNANNFNDALINFGKSLEVFDVLTANKLITQTFDTTTCLYAGIAAEKASKPDQAAIFYSKIADHNIKSDGFIEIYKWLADFYSKKNDIASASKYLNKGRQVYPEDAFWDAFDIEMIREKGTKDELFKKYEDVIARNPTNHLFMFNYGVELYQIGYDPEIGKRPANSKDLIARSAVQLKKCLELKPDYASAHMVLGQLIYNEGVDINNDNKAIRPPAGGKLKPEELKKKNDLRAEVTKKFNESLPYFEKVDQLLGGMGKLKMEDKSILKDAYDLIITIYENSGNKEKAEEYTTKYNDVDKKHS